MLSEFSFQFKSFLIVVTISGDNTHNFESYTLKKLLQMYAFKLDFV